MKEPIRKVLYKRMWLYIVGGILLVLTMYLTVQGIRCGIAVKNGVLHAVHSKQASAKKERKVFMCTSFTYRGNDTLIAMNYDNNGMNLQLEPHNPKLFLVTINSFGQNRPLFGVRSNGVFANQQVVDECTAGKFKIGYHVTHTADLIKKVLYGKIAMDKMDTFLSKHQIVNPPQNSLHTMIADARGSCYIVEPGRGILKYEQSERYVVMSNCPIFGAKEKGQYDGFGVDRQLKAEDMLKEADENFDVANAFDVLKAVHQTDPVWHTEFSFVYSANENAVYYCYNHEFDNIKKYQMS